MKTVIIIESAEELLECANPTREKVVGDKTPYLGDGKLVFEEHMKLVRLESEGFSPTRPT